MLKNIRAIMFAGYLLGLLFLYFLDTPSRSGAGVGWVLCACIELVLLRRRLAVLKPAAPSTAFAVVLVGGFLFKLALLVGLALLARHFELFQPEPFLLAFLAALLWGETLSLILLHRRPHSGISPAGLMDKET